MNRIADTSVGFGKDGRIFIGAMSFFPRDATPLMRANELEPVPGLLYGYIDIASSTDGGKTLSTPVHVMGQSTPQQEYGPGLKPRFLGKTPYDRPFIVTDQSTGTVYIPGNGSGGEPVHPETFIRASDDNGQTFGLIYAYDSPEFPEGGMAARPAAANGVLGVAYMASSAPSDLKVKCPCIVFGASRDEGKTFDRHIVQSNVPVPHGFTGMGAPGLAADPSHPGRFAIMSLTEGDAAMQVFVTDDYGKTWSGPVPAGGTPGTSIVKPDIAYSPRGELAVVWMALKPDETFTCWSAVSHDGGKQFSKPLEVSEAPSPGAEIHQGPRQQLGWQRSQLDRCRQRLRAHRLGGWACRVPWLLVCPRSARKLLGLCVAVMSEFAGCHSQIVVVYGASGKKSIFCRSRILRKEVYATF